MRDQDKTKELLINELRELKQVEQRYQSIFELDPDGIIMIDAKGKILLCNKAFINLSGLSKEEIVGKHFSKLPLLRARDLPKYVKLFASIVSGKEIEPFEFTWTHKDGASFSGEFRAALIKSGRRIIGVQAVARDITERKQIEHNLGERVKELNCLYGIAEIVGRPGITLDEILQETVNLIPPSWQYPEVTCARIKLAGKELKTDNFKPSQWRQSADIVVNGQKEGPLEVYYLVKKPESDEGPFLKEERLLTTAIAERLGRIIERKQAEEKQEQLIQELQETLKEVRTLSGLLPICAWCKKLRGDDGYWKSVEQYIGERTKAQFTHGICPECNEKLLQDEDRKLNSNTPQMP
jgi:PAS domain S-box-containing protein